MKIIIRRTETIPLRTHCSNCDAVNPEPISRNVVECRKCGNCFTSG